MIVELPYTLHTRYRSIAIAWTVILIPPIFINIALFYGLWYGRPQMDRILVLTIPTAILGLFTAIAIIERIYKLTQSSPQFRPLNSPRYALDVFQWGYFASLLLISILISTTLARGDIDDDGHELQTRLVSLPAALLMFFLACLTLVSLVLNRLKWEVPFRFGSLDKGNVLRPAVYYIVEDVVAVDGDGGLEYREALVKRYESSLVFQRMIWTLSVVWMLAFFVLAIYFAVLIFYLPVVAVYAVGWAGPFPLAGLLAVWTIFYVKSVLREERAGGGLEGQSEGRENMVEDTGNIVPSAPESTVISNESTPLLNNRVSDDDESGFGI